MMSFSISISNCKTLPKKAALDILDIPLSHVVVGKSGLGG